jgi:DEAD/DEAH box helicase domain-containing protein
MEDRGDFPGGIHAAEHGMISLFPLELLCDRGDIGASRRHTTPTPTRAPSSSTMGIPAASA